MTPKTFLNNFAHLADAPNGIQKLRQLILQLAVQGKLVPQDPNDEPADVLAHRIEKERKGLLSDRATKSIKFRPKIGESEKVLNIPATWRFVRLGALMRKMGAGSTPLGGRRIYQEEGVAFLRSQNVWNSGIRLDGVARIPSEIHNKMGGTWIEPGDVLLNITGASIGRCACVPDEFKDANVSQHVAILRLIDKELRHYIHLCVISPYFQRTIMEVQVGVSREGLSMNRLRDFVVPLPPLAEQKRIVAKVDELMALCDDLEARQQQRTTTRTRLHKASLDALLNADTPKSFNRHWTRIRDHFHILHNTPQSIQSLRQAILQLAVQGKLVPQNPNDEPAELLLAKTNELREALVARREIKRPRKLPPAEESDWPFELPKDWRWSRLGSLSRITEYGTSQKCSASGEVPVLRMNNIEGGVLNFEKLKYTSKNIKDLPRLYLRPGDLLFNRTNSYELVGKTAVYWGESDSHSFASYLIRVALFHDFVSPAYVNLAMNANYYRTTQIEPELTQQCGQANFNGTKLQSTLIPLPPLAEQKRIVAKVDQLMALCDALEAKLNDADTHRQKLMEAIVRHLSAA